MEPGGRAIMDMNIPEKIALIAASVFQNTVLCLTVFVSICSLGQFIDGQDKVKLKKLRVIEDFYKGYFSPDGTKLALLSEKLIVVRAVSTWKIISRIMPSDPTADVTFESATFSPDGKTLGVGFHATVCKKNEKDNSFHCELSDYINLYNAATGEPVKTLISARSEYGTENLTFSADGRFLGGLANVPRVFDIASGRETYQAKVASNYLTHFTRMSRDARWLAAYAEVFMPPTTLRTFFVTDLKSKQQKELSKDQVFDFRFSTDSTLLLTSNNVIGNSAFGERVCLKIYETGTWNLKGEIASTDFINSFDISLDKQLVAGGGMGTFKIFSLNTGKLLAEEYHYKRTREDDREGRMQLISFLTQVEFSPDGKTLLTGGEDGTVKLWSIKRRP
jgi:WD40 repeat protein